MAVLRAIVLRAPGINCDRETAQACREAGFETDLVHINQLIKDPDRLLDYQFLVIPGGFSYGDDLGAGTLLAKNLTIHLGKQLHQFIDEERPVLGICNGFQVLIRAGLLPGSLDQTNIHLSQATLTENASAQFECRWVRLATQPSSCIFTNSIDHPIKLPVAHGEGQFVLNGSLEELQANGQIPLIYTIPTTNNSQESFSIKNVGASFSSPVSLVYTDMEVPYPANPNGSLGNVAGICNTRGNVFGLMPHPERFITPLQHPQRRAGQADGLLIFKNAYNYILQSVTPKSVSYAASGVDIAAGEKAVQLMKEAVRLTHGSEVLAGIGAFAGVFRAQSLQTMRNPVLVSSTDGVGTKTLIAAQAGRYETIGYDIVNHSVNDLLMQGARPLFFMDYIAMSKLDPEQAATIVKGIANACREAGCALLGGETAEMPDVYLPGAFDLAGTIVGVAEEDEIINGSTIVNGDLIFGLPSSGLHTNGFSLARRIFAPYSLDTIFPELGEPLVDALLQPHRSYLHEITQLRNHLAQHGQAIKGLAHITGGGFKGNISRILPFGLQAIIDTHAWNVPPLFQLIAKLGNVPPVECYQALNMGIGVVIILSPQSAQEALHLLPELLPIGKIAEGHGVVVQC